MGLVADAALATPAAAAPLQATPEQHPATQDVYWDGQVFDAGGAVLNLGDWPGFWQDMQHLNLINQFQKDFNCTVQYDSFMALVPEVRRGRAAEPTARRHELEHARTVQDGSRRGLFRPPR